MKFTAKVLASIGIPTGNVMFTVDGVTYTRTLDSTGSASISLNQMAVSATPHTVLVQYLGPTSSPARYNTSQNSIKPHRQAGWLDSIQDVAAITPVYIVQGG